MQVQDIVARKILNSRGSWALEIDLKVDDRWNRASVPAGKSRGRHEVEQFSADKSLSLVKKFKDELVGIYPDQKSLDDKLKKKKKFGVDLILATSIAAVRAQGTPYKVIAGLTESKTSIPTPMLNILNGGLHAGNGLSVQEFMIVPHRFGSFEEKMEASVKVYQKLRENLIATHGKNAVNVGDEGGFAPPMETTQEALSAIQKVLDELGYTKSIQIALDCAASSYFEGGKYLIDGQELSKDKYIDYIDGLVKKFGLFSIEDPIEENDFGASAELTKKVNCTVVGDDLLLTNPDRVKKAMKMKASDAVLVKPNQIGTITETLEVIKMAKESGWKFVISHRSGETNDDFISHLAVGTAAPLFKSGAPARGERTCKYNKLMKLEKVIG